ncbi:MAG: hypothetical protein QXT13_07815 [Pyrobaculum sp.]
MSWEQLRRQVLAGNQTAWGILWNQLSDPSKAIDWLRQFNVSISGDVSSPFAQQYIRGLAWANVTGILPVQDISIVFEHNPAFVEQKSRELTGDPNAYGALTVIEGPDRLRVVYKNRDGRLLPLHEAVHAIQHVASRLYGRGGYSPPASETFANALAEWLLGTYRQYDQDTLREIVENILKGKYGGEWWYNKYRIWPLPEQRPADLRPLLMTSLDERQFYNMLKQYTGDTSTTNVTTVSNSTVDNKIATQNTLDKTAPSPSGASLPDVIRRYATESGKVVLFGEGWPGIDPKTYRDVLLNIAWYGTVKDGKLVLEGRCIEYPDRGWVCEEGTRGVPTSAGPIPLKVVHRGNVVGQVLASDLGKEVLDLKGGKGTPWDNLFDRVKVSRAPGDKPTPEDVKTLDELSKMASSITRALGDLANLVFGVYASEDDRGVRKTVIRTPFGEREVKSPEEARKVVEDVQSRLLKLPSGSWVAKVDTGDRAILEASVWATKGPFDPSPKLYKIRAIVDKKTGNVTYEGLPEGSIYIPETIASAGSNVVYTRGVWWDPKTGKTERVETGAPPKRETTQSGGGGAGQSGGNFTVRSQGENRVQGGQQPLGGVVNIVPNAVRRIVEGGQQIAGALSNFAQGAASAAADLGRQVAEGTSKFFAEVAKVVQPAVSTTPSIVPVARSNTTAQQSGDQPATSPASRYTAGSKIYKPPRNNTAPNVATQREQTQPVGARPVDYVLQQNDGNRSELYTTKKTEGGQTANQNASNTQLQKGQTTPVGARPVDYVVAQQTMSEQEDKEKQRQGRTAQRAGRLVAYAI